MSQATSLPTKLIRFTVILLFGSYTLLLYVNEQLLLYIHPRLLVFTVGMAAIAVVLAVLGIVTTLFAFLKSKNVLASLHIRETFNRLAQDKKLYLIFGVGLLTLAINFLAFLLVLVLILPLKASLVDKWLKQVSWLHVLMAVALGFAFLVAPHTLSPQAAAQTSAGLNALAPSGGTADALALFNLDYDKYTIGDWIKAINLNPDLQSYADKPVNVVGFVFEPDSVPQGQFLVSRFVISCCAVDARPVGINVLAAEQLAQFKPGDWVQVKGKYQVANINGEDSLQIVPTEITATQQPKSPYIY